jgi:hypothetical protein
MFLFMQTEPIKRFIKFGVVCTVHFIVSLSQNQQINKVINKHKMYLQPLLLPW